MLLETEQVPCVNDDVVFQRYHTYYINLGSDLKLTVKTLKLMGKVNFFLKQCSIYLEFLHHYDSLLIISYINAFFTAMCM